MMMKVAAAILNVVILKLVPLLITSTHFLSRTAHSSIYIRYAINHNLDIKL
jgi:hypothetical protein